MCPSKVQSVDDFVPDERLDKSFLEDSLPSKNKVQQPAPTAAVDSDSDGEMRGNPMVSGFQDELDPDDSVPSLPQPQSLAPGKDVTLSSDEEAAPTQPAITVVQDIDSEPELMKPHILNTKPKVPESKAQSGAPISLTLTPALEQTNKAPQAKKKNSSNKTDSDSDPEAPVAQQMLSFVMDDPDFESEASDTPKVTADAFPVRDELLSDLSDDERQLVKVPEPPKSTAISFKHKDHSDLFGLGFTEEPSVTKDSSDEQDAGKSQSQC